MIAAGLVGCGGVTQTRHLPALVSLQGVKVVGLADVDQATLTSVADRFGIAQRFTDYRALFDRRDIDVVGVCVPARFHVQVALAALEAGKHVFIEKPLALSLDESDRLIETVARSNLKTMVGFNMRWHRLTRRARDIIRQGKLGRIEFIRTVFTNGVRYLETVPAWRKRRDQGGGVLFEIAPHHVDLWRFLLESEIAEVFARTRSGEWDDETATLTARMANGALASSTFSEAATETNELEICGRSGRLHVSCYRFDGLELFGASSHPGDPCRRARKVFQTLREFPAATRAIARGGDWIASYRAEWSHFIDAIQHDGQVESTVEDGRAALRIVLAAIESASSGKAVKIGIERTAGQGLLAGPVQESGPMTDERN